MLTIRFLRTGKKNQPFFRIVVTDKKNPPKGGKFLEIVGFFNPITKERQLNGERIKYWLSVGAKASDRVHNLLVSEKIIKAQKINVFKKPKKKEGETNIQPEPEAKPAVEPEEEAKPESGAEKDQKIEGTEKEKEDQKEQTENN